MDPATESPYIQDCQRRNLHRTPPRKRPSGVLNLGASKRRELAREGGSATTAMPQLRTIDACVWQGSLGSEDKRCPREVSGYINTPRALSATSGTTFYVSTIAFMPPKVAKCPDGGTLSASNAAFSTSHLVIVWQARGARSKRGSNFRPPRQHATPVEDGVIHSRNSNGSIEHRR